MNGSLALLDAIFQVGDGNSTGYVSSSSQFCTMNEGSFFALNSPAYVSGTNQTFLNLQMIGKDTIGSEVTITVTRELQMFRAEYQGTPIVYNDANLVGILVRLLTDSEIRCW